MNCLSGILSGAAGDLPRRDPAGPGSLGAVTGGFAPDGAPGGSGFRW